MGRKNSRPVDSVRISGSDRIRSRIPQNIRNSGGNPVVEKHCIEYSGREKNPNSINREDVSPVRKFSR